MKRGNVMVCTAFDPHFASEAAFCAKCTRLCYYTTLGLDHIKKQYGDDIVFWCDGCAALGVSKATDADIRKGLQTARAGLPAVLRPLIDEVDPEGFREYFRKKIPQ